MSPPDDGHAAEIVSERAALGPARRDVTIAEVSALVVQDFDAYALLRWSWPERCSQVLLTWRADGYPRAPDDPRASRRRITRAEYDRHGGFQLERPAAMPHHFVLYAMGQVDGQAAFAAGNSAGARALMRHRSSVTIAYSIKRQWLRRRHVTIALRSSALIEFMPMVIVVAKPGELQPISVSDGQVVLELSGLRLAPGAATTQDIDLSALRTPVYLRAFFPPNPGGQRFRLIDPPHEQLKIQ